MTRLMLEIPKLNRLKEQSMRELAECESLGESREEICFETGIYDNDCDCGICIHKDECSGYEGD